MKEMQYKKMLKEAGVLLIAAVMVLSTLAVTANTNDQSLELMLAGVDNIPTSQQTNTFDPDWIHFDDGTNVNSIGLTSGGSFEWGIRITPDELADYDGYELTTVKFHHGWVDSPAPTHSGNIYVYEAGTPTSPGNIIPSATTPWTHTGSDWVEIELASPVTVDSNEDIWVTIDVTHAAGEYPAGVGPGPMVPGKGGWITMDGVTWEQIGDLGLDYNWNIWAKVEEGSMPPETPERPEGPTEGVTGVEYTFLTSTTDPEGEQVYYLWDWGDGTSSEWLGPYDSGATVLAAHGWSETGEYDITVKAKDVHNVESDWSDPKTIHIADAAILEIGNISGGLFKVSTVIKNTGGVDVIKINWSITLDGGLILLGKETTGNIISLSAGDEKTVSSGLILGFGKTVITVSAETAESSDTAERDAFVLLFIIL